MILPTKNWVTCDATCHGYLATDYSWHISKYNYLPRKDWKAIVDSTITDINKSAGDCGILVQGEGLHNGKKLKWRGCHSEKVYVTKGSKVKEGEAVAKMGNTGKSTGVHLHFVLWVDGKRVDPDKWIKENMMYEDTPYKDIKLPNKTGYQLYKEDVTFIFDRVPPTLGWTVYQAKYKNWGRAKFLKQLAISNYDKYTACQEKESDFKVVTETLYRKEK
jgi:hypothetical protein